MRHTVKNKIKTRISKGFTLAEVLITLLIIGIIASMVIPVLINDTQNQEFTVLLKKDFSTFSDAAKRIMMDNGGTLAGFFNDSDDMINKFGNYAVFTKKCYRTQGCFYAGTNTWKNLHGDDGWMDHTNSSYASTAILNNGGLVMFRFEQTDCERNYGTGSPAEHTCGWIHVDVNGFKGPNIMGKDIFRLWITKTGIYPFGIPNNEGYSHWDWYCNKNDPSTMSGSSCSALILTGGTVR